MCWEDELTKAGDPEKNYWRLKNDHLKRHRRYKTHLIWPETEEMIQKERDNDGKTKEGKMWNAERKRKWAEEQD